MIVFLDGGTSGYLNWKEAGRMHRQAWETVIVNDISSHLCRHFNVTSGQWGIGGLSQQHRTWLLHALSIHLYDALILHLPYDGSRRKERVTHAITSETRPM